MDFDPEKIAKEITKGLEVDYYSLCCRKNMHKMYHVMGAPCPCKKVQEKVKMEKFYKSIASVLLHVPQYPRIEDILTIEPLTEEQIKQHEEEEKRKEKP